MKNSIPAFLFLLLASVSCNIKADGGAALHPYVKEILQDREGTVCRMLEASSTLDPGGAIYLFGCDRSVLNMAEFLSTCDLYDNVDGTMRPDGLPDFAGETISCVLDTTGFTSSLAARAMSGGDDADFRERILREVVSAIDTVCHITPYDVIGVGNKEPAKVLILADPQYSAFAAHDIDTLLASTGSGISLIASSKEMLDVINAAYGPDASFGVITEEGFAVPALYGGALVRVPYPVSDSLLVDFLDAYVAAGRDEVLDAIAVDNSSLVVSELKNRLADIISVMNEQSVRYGRLISKDFRFVSAREAAMSRCYEILRTGNLFTHNIAKPQINVYYTSSEPDGGKGLYLVPGFYVQN